MIRHREWATGAAALLLLSMISLAPLPFGSVMPRELAALEVGAFLALAFAVAGRAEAAPLRAVAAPALALAAAGTFGLVQALPWPRPVVGLLSPEALRLWQGARHLLGNEAGGGVPLSLAPGVSSRVGLIWLAVAACLVAAAVVGGSRRVRRALGAALLGAAIFEIVYGTNQWFALRKTIWGLEVPGNPTRLRGTFVNPDHFALFLGVVLMVVFAWLWWAVRRALGERSLDRGLLVATPPGLVFLMVFVGLAFTGSRAGLLAAGAGLLAQTGLLVAYHRSWKVAMVGAGAVALGVLGVVLFGLQEGLGRWMETSAYEVTWSSRLQVYRAALELWGRFPWVGTGLGTFRESFPLVQPAGLTGTWIHAHCDLLEMLVTTGVVVLPLLAIGAVGATRRLWQVLHHARRSEDRAAGVAALGALVTVVVHSLVDFGLTMPANAFTVAALVGVAAGVPAGPSRRRSSRPSAAAGATAGRPGASAASRTSPG